MINILYEEFPDYIIADGEEYKIQTDFREWLRFADLQASREIDDRTKILLMSEWLDEPPTMMTKGIVKGLMDFLRANALSQKNEAEECEKESPHPPYFDFTIDARWILGDFLRFYGIDLLTVEELHWWKFRALLAALPDDSMTMKRVAYRSIELGTIKDNAERQRIAKIQRQIAIPFKMDDEMIGAVMWN